MRGYHWSWFFFAAAALAVASFAEFGAHGEARRDTTLAAERRNDAELLKLREENRRLAAARPSAQERAGLESRHAEAQKLRSRLNALQTGVPEAKTGANGDNPPTVVAATDWVYSGRADPKSAVESVLWAASRGDVDRLSELLGFAPEVRAQAQAMFSQLPAESQAEYGSAEKVVATLLAGGFPKDASAMRMLGEWQTGQGAVVSVTVDHADGQAKFNQLNLIQSSDGWKLLVPAGVMAGYEKMLAGALQPADASNP